MTTGVIDRTYNSGQVQKQVLVVVTSGLSVMCFDHNLQKLREKNPQEDSPHNAHLREMAISISNTTLKYGEAGLVLIGGRMEMQTNMHMDPFEEINIWQWKMLSSIEEVQVKRKILKQIHWMLPS